MLNMMKCHVANAGNVADIFYSLSKIATIIMWKYTENDTKIIFRRILLLFSSQKWQNMYQML